ncbi:anti-sigma-factor antagonist [Planococcus donghaensis MPA1U2]|uniref:Anti-sigma-factor antagonist n=1 Tax=Planococcus donghaensis MPA1U2 TaxID=933115 RepID=E7RIX7_9BACL|nr:STAS domain-containing protein [Planococcus donghaensis]EGA88987.1 anti-sigma-factor antagonist [Planococcus donghaensis MPA1U2]
MSSFKDFSKYISENAGSLSAEVVESVVQEMSLTIPEWEKERAAGMYVQLLEFFGQALLESGQIEVPDALIEWSKKNAEMQIASGGALSMIAIRYPVTRKVFSEIFTRLSVEFELTVVENAKAIQAIHAVLDVSLNETIFAFEQLSERKQAETRVELLNLSAPIVPVLEDVVVLPLIGVIDSYRIAHIMNNVIPKIAEKKVLHVITDFSGVLTIDDHVALSLQQIGSTLQLMGIHVVIAGLRPDLVQAIVHSGIDMLDTESYATVKQALESVK